MWEGVVLDPAKESELALIVPLVATGTRDTAAEEESPILSI